MLQHELKPNSGAKKNRKRVGRGNASGTGTFSGRGCKGQGSRSGGSLRPGFEGGQTPLYKRLPKLKGFKNYFRKEFQIVNVSSLKDIKAKVITSEELLNAGVIRKKNLPVKILGNGDISIAVTVRVDKISKIAREKIEKAGGKVEQIVNEVEKAPKLAKEKIMKVKTKK